MLRLQRERMESAFVPSLLKYAARWGITQERLHPGQVVMHPGPINRGVEIDGRVAEQAAVARSRAGPGGASRCGWPCCRSSLSPARALEVVA